MNTATLEEPKTISWATPDTYGRVLDESKRTGKPILLDLHLPSCQGCQSLERNVYTSPEVMRAIHETTLPIRVVMEHPTPAATEIINNHIFIWSPTVQLVAPNRTRYHEWNGAPRHTRLSVNYHASYADYAGDLTPDRFLAQLLIGRAKAAHALGNNAQALELFDEVVKSNTSEVAVREARHWSGVIRSNNARTRPFAREALVGRTPLARAAEKLAYAVAGTPDSALMDAWKGTPGPGDWKWYSDCLREIVLQAYQELSDFAAAVDRERDTRGPAVSIAQRLLAQAHLAYREFQGAFIGLDDSALDEMPYEGERSLRENLAHVILAEWWAYRPQINHAVACFRAKQQPSTMPATDVVKQSGEPVATFETIHELLGRYEELHNRAMAEFAAFTDEEVAARSLWWEAQPVEVRFRLKRLNWHLRDHAVTVERIRTALGRHRSANEHFACRVIMGLGLAEGALLGAANTLSERQGELTAYLEKKAQEVEELRRRPENSRKG